MQKPATFLVTTALILSLSASTLLAQRPARSNSNVSGANTATAARSQSGNQPAGNSQPNALVPGGGKAPAGEAASPDQGQKVIIRRPVEESVVIDGVVVKANSIVVAKKNAIVRHLTKAETLDSGHTVKVRKVSEGWLWVRGGTLAGWVHKLDVIPFEKAVADIDAVMQSRKKSVLEVGAVGAYAQGNRALSEGNYDAAIQGFNAAIQSSPNAAGPAYAGLGEAQLGKQQYQEAIESLTMAIQEDDKNHVALYNRGYAKQMLGDLDPALEDYNKAILISGEGNADPWYYLQRGLCWYEKGEKQKAFEDHEIFVKNQPPAPGRLIAPRQSVRLEPAPIITDGGPPIVYGPPPESDDTYWSPEELDEAIANFSEAIRLNDQFTLAYNGRGWAKYRKKQFAEAAADFDRAIELAEAQQLGSSPDTASPAASTAATADPAQNAPANGAANNATDLFKQ